MKKALLVVMLAVVPSLGLSAQTVTVVNTTIVRLGEGDPLPNRTVVVSDGRIVSIEPSQEDSVPPEGAWIDGEGLYLAPGRVELGVSVAAEDSLEWREELLVRLSRGVTTLGVSGLDARALDSIWDVVPEGYPAPRLAVDGPGAGSIASGGLPTISIGAEADLLVLEEDPLRDSTALRRPLAVIVDGRVYPRAQLAASAGALGRRIRGLPYLRAPRIRDAPRTSWPRSCVGESFDECFGGDPECGLLLHTLLPHLTLDLLHISERDCLAPSVGEDRAALLRSLDRLATVAPSDDWIAGQRAYLALLEGDYDHAWNTAEGCSSELWWCQALRGLVLHQSGEGSVGVVFDSAYANAPPDTPAWRSPKVPGAGDRGLPCEWSDVSHLIEDPDLEADYTAVNCGARSEFETRFWWLSDPFWSRPGNARRDEHMARNVLARLRDDILRYVPAILGPEYAHCTVSLDTVSVDAETFRDVAPGDNRVWCMSSHEELVAYGPPNSWRGVPYVTRRGFPIGADGVLQKTDPESRCLTLESRGMCTTLRHAQLREGFLNGGYSFVPDAASAYLTPETSTAEDWALTWNEGHERMLTRETWYNLDHQTAVLRRGDKLRILAAARFPTLLPSLDSLKGFLAVGRGADQHVDVTPAEVDRGTGILRAGMTVPDDGWIVSIEALAPEVRGRARLGAPPPLLLDGFGISRPVLMPADFDPAVDDVLAAMLPARSVPGGGRVGLYVELYGVEAGQTAQMALTYDPGEQEPSFFGRIAGVFGFGGDDGGPVRIEWTEQLEEVEDGIGRVFVASDLGDFEDRELLLTMSASVGGRTATAATMLQPRR